MLLHIIVYNFEYDESAPQGPGLRIVIDDNT